MKLKANDTLAISNVKNEPIQPGEQFEIEDGQGADLVKRGLATEVKAAKVPENKKAAEPSNKSGSGKA